MKNLKNKLLSLTPNAIKHLKSILEDSPDAKKAIKLGVKMVVVLGWLIQWII